jgi:GDPmannose 4,6-dehydratase
VAPQNELTGKHPQSPYAIAKLAAYHLCHYYRDVYDLFVSTGICFNHDSVRRQGDYLLHSIARQSVDVCRGKKETAVVGSLDLSVDIGSAEEFVTLFHGILQLSKPGDFVVGTGVSVTVRELIRIALDEAGKTLGKPAKAFLVEDRSLRRPGTPPMKLVADNGKLASFGLRPEKTSETVLREIVQHYAKEGK